MRLLRVSDIHLNYLKDNAKSKFIKVLDDEYPDAVAISGGVILILPSLTVHIAQAAFDKPSTQSIFDF